MVALLSAPTAMLVSPQQGQAGSPMVAMPSMMAVPISHVPNQAPGQVQALPPGAHEVVQVPAPATFGNPFASLNSCATMAEPAQSLMSVPYHNSQTMSLVTPHSGPLQQQLVAGPHPGHAGAPGMVTQMVGAQPAQQMCLYPMYSPPETVGAQTVYATTPMVQGGALQPIGGAAAPPRIFLGSGVQLGALGPGPK